MVNINEFILNCIRVQNIRVGCPLGIDIRGDIWESPAYWFQYHETEFCEVIWSLEKKEDGDR
jgi:hypothetical protein